MTDKIEVTRTIELDLEPGEVWELIGNGERWAEWMVDTAAVEVSPGAIGDVTDGSEHRDVRIDRVDDGERVAFDWWPVGRRGEASSVELLIVPVQHGTMLEIVESFPAAGRLSASASAWRARGRHLGTVGRMLVAA